MCFSWIKNFLSEKLSIGSLARVQTDSHATKVQTGDNSPGNIVNQSQTAGNNAYQYIDQSKKIYYNGGPENERAKDIAQRVERFELLENKLNRMKAAIIIDDGKINVSGDAALDRIHDWAVDVCKKGERVGFLGNYTDNRFLESFNEWSFEFIKTAYLLWSEIFPPDLYPEELKRYTLRMLESLTPSESDLVSLMESATKETKYEGSYYMLYHYSGKPFSPRNEALRGESKQNRYELASKVFLFAFVSPSVKEKLRREAEMNDPSRRKNLTFHVNMKNKEIKVDEDSHEK